MDGWMEVAADVDCKSVLLRRLLLSYIDEGHDVFFKCDFVY